jgi:hypothetical protein
VRPWAKESGGPLPVSPQRIINDTSWLLGVQIERDVMLYTGLPKDIPGRIIVEDQRLTIRTDLDIID